MVFFSSSLSITGSSGIVDEHLFFFDYKNRLNMLVAICYNFGLKSILMFQQNFPLNKTRVCLLCVYVCICLSYTH